MIEKMPLFDYQEELINKVISGYGNNKNTLITLPTGTGKSRIIIEAIKKMSIKGGRFAVIAPTRLLVNSLWKKEFAKWGVNIKNSGIFPIDGSRPIEERRKFWNHAREYSWNIICTPQTFTNDSYRGFFNIEEFSIIHLDEAHHLSKKNNDKYEISKSYEFLKHRVGPISGTTIRSSNKKVSGSGKLINAEIMDDRRAVTQEVKTIEIIISDQLRIDFDEQLSKASNYYVSSISRLFGKKFTYGEIIRHLNNPENLVKNLTAENKSKAWNYCSKIAKLEYLRNLCFQDEIIRLNLAILRYIDNSSDKRFINFLEKMKKIQKKWKEKN